MKTLKLWFVIGVCFITSAQPYQHEAFENFLSPSQALMQFKNYMHNLIVTFNLPRSQKEQQDDVALTRQELSTLVITHNKQHVIPYQLFEKLMSSYHQRLTILYPKSFIQPPFKYTVSIKALLQRIGLPVKAGNIGLVLEKSKQYAEKIAPVNVAPAPVQQPILRSRHRRP